MSTATPIATAWSRPPDEITAALHVDPVLGLTSAEAARRLAGVGPNDLPQEPPRSVVASVLGQLRETMILVLLGAAVLTALTGDYADCAVILLVIAVNTTVGVLQERRAIGAVAAPGRAPRSPPSTPPAAACAPSTPVPTGTWRW